MPRTDLTRLIRESGLVEPGDRGLVLVSGGADSICLLAGLADHIGPDSLTALHVNYGLRSAADDDQALVQRACGSLGVELTVHRAGVPAGNTQAWAREVRLREAESIRQRLDLDWIAVGHNRSDQAETFLYRLASSPGARPLLAMPARSGHVIRPLLGASGREIRALAADLQLEFAEDLSNQDPVYARNRIRLEVLPALELVNPAVELNIARTRQELQEDEEALAAIASGILNRSADEGLDARVLAEEPPAVVRRLLRLMAESALGRPVAVNAAQVVASIRLAGQTEGGRLDLGGGDSLLVEAGRVSVEMAGSEGSVLEPVEMMKGEAVTSFGDWSIESSMATEEEARMGFGNPWVAWLDLEEREASLRPWREGDRIEPLGMSGSKKLQDVFTDGLVPASRRRRWPILEVEGNVVWVPGLARSRHFLIGGPDKPVLRLQARPPFDP